METTTATMKKVIKYRMSIQRKQRSADGTFRWDASPEFDDFDEMLNAYKDWLKANPGRRISFSTNTAWVPA